MHASQEVWALVADEHALIRSGMKHLLAEAVAGLRFVEVVDGLTLMKTARSEIGLVAAVIDLNLPQLQSGAALVEVSRLRPTLPLIVLSGWQSPEMVRRVTMLPNVYAVVSKNAELREIRHAFGAALRGERVAGALPLSVPRGPAGLTPRQGEVHRLLCQGLSNKSISALLGISVGTVKNHVYDIFRVLKTTNRTQAAQLLSDVR